jgi:hypothetical protein
MNHVSKVKKIFENSESSQAKLRNEQNFLFARSKTLIDFSQLKKQDDNLLISENQSQNFKNSKRQFERQQSDNSTYRSVRRSPAFRRVNGPTAIATADAKLTRPTSELEYLATSETIKKALKSPLPPGPPPTKPPRIFTSPLSTFTVSLAKNNANHPPKEANSNLNSIEHNFKNKLQISDKKHFDKEAEEKIYMQPFAHLKKSFTINDNKFSNKLASPSSSKTEELHYLCTDIFDEHTNLAIQQDSSGSSRRSSLNSGNHNLSEIDKVR